MEVVLVFFALAGVSASFLVDTSALQLAVACMTAVKSPNARLRWGGLRCLGLMLHEDEQWTFSIHQQYGEQLLALLSQECAGDQSKRCRRQALLALSAFIFRLAPERGEDPSPETLAAVSMTGNSMLAGHASRFYSQTNTTLYFPQKDVVMCG